MAGGHHHPRAVASDGGRVQQSRQRSTGLALGFFRSGRARCHDRDRTTQHPVPCRARVQRERWAVARKHRGTDRPDPRREVDGQPAGTSP